MKYSINLSKVQLAELEEILKREGKIAAVQFVHKTTKAGLKNSKDFVDELEDQLGLKSGTTPPNKWENNLEILKKITALAQGVSEIEKATAEVTEKNKKPGRNAPCPCGSGKKYKKCCLNKQSVYAFKFYPKHTKGIWRKVELLENQELWDFDQLIKREFNLDESDHLSEFYRGKAFKAKGYGAIYPDGSGDGERVKIKNLYKNVGDKFEYLYDFGSSFYVEIILEDVKTIEERNKNSYPRVLDRSKPKFEKCPECKENAVWICINCSEEENRRCIFCDDCIEIHDEQEHITEKVLY